jgi:hypothetical protein
MTEQQVVDRFPKEILEFLGETFERVRGIYLDKGTSLFETLDAVTAEEASGRASDSSASVAAHVKHMSYYLRVLQQSIRGEPLGKLDWRKIWEEEQSVDEESWRAIVAELREEHANVVRLLSDSATWEKEDALGGSMAIVVHTAYHLGAIRQALTVIRMRTAL